MTHGWDYCKKKRKNRRDDILQPCWEWLRLLSMLYLLGLSLVRNEDSGWWWNELQGFREDIRSASLGRDQCQIWTAPSESHAGQKMNHDSHEKPEPNEDEKKKKKICTNCTIQLFLRVTGLRRFRTCPTYQWQKQLPKDVVFYQCLSVSRPEMGNKGSRCNINHSARKKRQILEMTGSSAIMCFWGGCWWRWDGLKWVSGPVLLKSVEISRDFFFFKSGRLVSGKWKLCDLSQAWSC